MSIFAGLTPLPPDAILGLVEEYVRDPRPDKVSLAAGVYVDESGITPVLDTVAEAEGRILAAQTTKLYKPVAGDPAYLRPVRELIFGSGHRGRRRGSRGNAAHTRGHGGIAGRRGPGPPPSTRRHGLDEHAHVAQPPPGVRCRRPGDGLVSVSRPDHRGAGRGRHAGGAGWRPGRRRGAAPCLLPQPHGHRPDADVWRRIGDVIAERGLLPLVDFAYQGFGDGLEQDARGLLELVRPGAELLVASSFSKNFSLYDERVGALSVVAATPDGCGDAAEPCQGDGSRELLQPAGPRRRDRGHHPRR